MTLTTEQVKLWKRCAVMVGDGTSSTAIKIMQARIIALADEVMANREAQPVGKAEITKIAAELVRGDYLSKLWAEAEKSRHVDTHRLQNLLDELHDVMKVKAIAITQLLTAPPAPAVPEEMNGITPYCHGWNECRAAMLGGDKPSTPTGWIACDDALPKDGENIITLNNVGGVYGGYIFRQYANGSWAFVDAEEEFREDDSVTHWRPLPEVR